MSDIAETFAEEMREIQKRQDKCDHEEITWHPRDDKEDIWKCENCDLHFKPKNRREERFLEWADDQSWLTYEDVRERNGDTE